MGALVTGAEETASMSVSPSTFLFRLRENGIQLSIEEEASLLDCLDMEHQAEICSLQATSKHKNYQFYSAGGQLSTNSVLAQY